MGVRITLPAMRRAASRISAKLTGALISIVPPYRRAQPPALTRLDRDKRPLTRLDDADHRLVHRRRHAERFSQPWDRPVDGVHLAAPAGVVIQQHRRPRAGNLAAEFADVQNRIADIELHA